MLTVTGKDRLLDFGRPQAVPRTQEPLDYRLNQRRSLGVGSPAVGQKRIVMRGRIDPEQPAQPLRNEAPERFGRTEVKRREAMIRVAFTIQHNDQDCTDACTNWQRLCDCE